MHSGRMYVLRMRRISRSMVVVGADGMIVADGPRRRPASVLEQHRVDRCGEERRREW